MIWFWLVHSGPDNFRRDIYPAEVRRCVDAVAVSARRWWRAFIVSGLVVNRGVAFVSDVVGLHRAVHCEVGV